MTDHDTEMDTFHFIKAKDLAGLKKHINSGGECDKRDPSTNDTPLDVACDLEFVEFIPVLVKDGLADVDARKPPKMWTPLYTACFNGKVAVVRALTAAKADITVVLPDSSTPGELFAPEVPPKVIAEIRAILSDRMKKKVGFKHIYAHEAAKDGGERSIRRIKWFLEAGGGINSPDPSGDTMLHHAAREGHVDVALLLTDVEGVEIDPRDGKQWTPLFLAASKGHLQMCRLLVSKGANVNAKTNNGRSPLHAACRFGQLDVMCFLLDHGAALDARDGNDTTPLQKAAELGFTELVKELLDRGADIANRDNEQLTALHYACKGEGSNPDVVRMLITRGANMAAVTDKGVTALHYAAENGHVEMMVELLDRGDEIDAVDHTGNTALHYACGKGREHAILELLKRGCDKSVLNQDDKGADEVIGKALPAGVLSADALAKIEKLLRDGPKDNKKKQTTVVETRCLCSVM